MLNGVCLFKQTVKRNITPMSCFEMSPASKANTPLIFALTKFFNQGKNNPESLSFCSL